MSQMGWVAGGFRHVLEEILDILFSHLVTISELLPFPFAKACKSRMLFPTDIVCLVIRDTLVFIHEDLEQRHTCIRWGPQ